MRFRDSEVEVCGFRVALHRMVWYLYPCLKPRLLYISFREREKVNGNHCLLGTVWGFGSLQSHGRKESHTFRASSSTAADTPKKERRALNPKHPKP